MHSGNDINTSSETNADPGRPETLPVSYDDPAMNNFLDRVREHGGITTRAEADEATRATVSTLAEAVSKGQMQDLGAGLPAALRPEINESRGEARSLGKKEFLERAGGNMHTVDIDTVEANVRAVLRAVYEWAPAGQTGDTVAQLPPGVADLFPAAGR
jgi:uncharacterized protein (DUF2267 family)